MAPDSLFLWADVFREPDESRDEYVERYGERVRNHWPLAPERQEQVINHLTSFDYPADRSEIESIAKASGWQ
jgi:hypothetical protein